MLRDRLVVGIRDAALSDKLQTESDLTLEKAKTLIRQKEAAKDHCCKLQDNLRESTLGKIDSRQFQKRSTSGGGKPRSHKGAAQPQRIKESKCSRCGRGKHQPGERCPAVGVTCHSYHKKGHFSVKCYKNTGSKTIVGALVTGPATSDSAMEEAFLGNLTAGQSQQPWMVELEVRGHIIPFKLDTGAEVTAITEQTYNRLGQPNLKSPSMDLPANPSVSWVSWKRG